MIIFKKTFAFPLNILHVVATDAFPASVVEQDDFVAVHAVDLVAVAIHGVPVPPLLDQEVTVAYHERSFVRVAVEFASRAVIYIPVPRAALNGYVPERIVVYILAVDAAHQIAFFVCQIPRALP